MITKIPSATVYQENQGERLKVQVVEWGADRPEIWTIWLPMAALGKNGIVNFEIVKSRMKHDYDVVVDYYTFSTGAIQ